MGQVISIHFLPLESDEMDRVIAEALLRPDLQGPASRAEAELEIMTQLLKTLMVLGMQQCYPTEGDVFDVMRNLHEAVDRLADGLVNKADVETVLGLTGSVVVRALEIAIECDKPE